MFPVDFIAQLPFFQDLPLAQVKQLEPFFTLCIFEPETVIFQQGDLAEHLYIVVSGEVIIRFKPEDGPALIVARVQPEGVVGWSAALGSRTYTSAALTEENTRLLRVRGADLRAICEKDEALGQVLLDKLASRIAERLRSTHPQVLALLQLGLGKSIKNHEVLNDIPR